MLDEFIKLAEYMAGGTGEILQKHFRSNQAVESKDDYSPVTEADREVERYLRRIIKEQRPQDGIYGEEFGHKKSNNGYTWVFDPIDGTKQFASGRANFVTLIALCYESDPIMSIMDQPILSERWIGAKGRVTTFNGREVSTHKCKSLKNAKTGITSPRNFSNYETLPVIHEATEFIAWGGHGYSFGQLASGWLDLVLEKHFGPFDTLPVVPIVQGAGGIITDWRGNPPNLDNFGKVVASGSPEIHEQILDLLLSCGEPAALPQIADRHG